MTFQQKCTNLREFYLVEKGPTNLGIGNPHPPLSGNARKLATFFSGCLPLSLYHYHPHRHSIIIIKSPCHMIIISSSVAVIHILAWYLYHWNNNNNNHALLQSSSTSPAFLEHIIFIYDCNDFLFYPHHKDRHLNHQDSQGNTMDNPMLALIETLAVTWFTLEYLLRSANTGEDFKFRVNQYHLQSDSLAPQRSGSFSRME